MTTTNRKGRLRRLIAWWLQSDRLRELRASRYTPEQRQLITEATSTLTVAERVLAGLEPVPFSTQSAAALPLISAGLDACRKVMSPELTLADLCDDQEWQARFTQGGLGNEQQAQLRTWLAAPGEVGSHTIAQHGLLALRAALDTTRSNARAIRRLLWRRIVLFAAFITGIAGLCAAVFLLLKPPGPPDIAAGKPWHASSFYPGFSSAGSKPARPIDGCFFSTNEEEGPWWTVDLQNTFTITGIEVVNRSDCCADRAFPLALEVSSDGKSWRQLARQNETFSTWEPKLPPTKARHVRLRGLKRTLLHFRDVKVHGTR